jgi:hypothetical protein
MGKLTLESSISECLQLRSEWVQAIVVLDDATADRNEARSASELFFKIYASPEYRNYYEVTTDLFGRKGREFVETRERRLSGFPERRIDRLIRETA